MKRKKRNKKEHQGREKERRRNIINGKGELEGISRKGERTENIKEG